ncbi:YceI family protein [Mucilaginibacter sp. X5P1]|uniref:YceI family protein n=1 Tax=Mucilaginibacter sp. X5P1 TaxID=2723088 RepID=UPI00160F0384|nr:YceI family protein [Mucilaginibacter sp. X5P1]MBB6138600.1 polyisoprenoid-binding protein YceI [Mucilaginibacter sp. X5P1]
MKAYSIIIALFICSVNIVFAQHYTPVEQSSTVQFKVSHQMIFKSTVTGTFKGLKGTVIFDPTNLTQAVFDVSIAAETINSGIGMRDNHLKEESYFDVKKYSSIIIKSQTVTKASGENTYTFTGTLTMKGVTKNISFPFTAKAQNGGYEFKGSFQLNRLEYNVGSDNSIDKNVEVDLDVIAR